MLEFLWLIISTFGIKNLKEASVQWQEFGDTITEEIFCQSSCMRRLKGAN